MLPCFWPDPQVIAGVVNLGDNLRDIFGGNPCGSHDLPRSHGDLCRVDSIGTEDGTAAAFTALIEIGKPFLENPFIQFFGFVTEAKSLASQGEVSFIDFSEEIGPGHWHVFGSPVPKKNWHLSAQAPHLTQISKKRRTERYLSRTSAIFFSMTSFQFSTRSLGRSIFTISFAFAG